MTDDARPLSALLRPRSVAIVGLSADPTKHGNRVLANLRKLGYRGTIWGVNPRGHLVDGIQTVPTVGALPERPDVLVCAVPAAVLPSVFTGAGDRGADVAIVFGGGYAESGPAGRRAQEQLVAAARRVGMRVLGPNSGGVVHAAGRVALSFLTWLDRPADQVRSGPVALVTQSGGTGSYIHSLAAARGGGLAASISTGNEADVDMAQAIAVLAERDEVRAIALVLEAVRDGPGFMTAVRAAHAAGKPVVAFRLGTSDHGRQAMRSHTGALAGSARVLAGVCDALGITMAETPAELLDVAEVMAASALPRGPRAGIVTHSGGTAILLSDLASRHGVSLPQPPAELASRLAPLLDHGTAANPVDLGAIIGGPHRFAGVVEQFLRSGAYDVVLAATTPHPPAHTEQRAESLLAQEASVPLLHLWMAGDLGAGGLATLRGAGAPVTEEPRVAIRALAGLRRLGELARKPAQPATALATPPLPATADEQAAKALLRDWGVPVVRGAHAATAQHAVTVADQLGYPVVVKISSPDILHKTDVDGVRAGLRSAAEVAAAFDDVVAAAAAHAPRAAVDGVLVEQYRPGLEMLVGMVLDATFGPIVLVGTGGIDAEDRENAVVAPAPVTVDGARRMVSRLRIPRLRLPGHRRAPDLDGLATIVSQVSTRFCAHDGGIVELEVNPLTWGAQGWLALDALLRLA